MGTSTPDRSPFRVRTGLPVDLGFTTAEIAGKGQAVLMPKPTSTRNLVPNPEQTSGRVYESKRAALFNKDTSKACFCPDAQVSGQDAGHTYTAEVEPVNRN